MKKKMMLKTNSINISFRVSQASLNPGRPTSWQCSNRSPASRSPRIQFIMFGKILDTASLLKAKIARDELDQALIEATNDDNWQASTTILHEIASSAYSHEKWKRISEFIWDKLKGNSRWKKLLKVMNIVQFLLKNGPGFAVDQLRRECHFFRTMESYQAYQEGTDRGAPIRERARAIVAMLSSEEVLEDERARAKQIRERMSHLSGTTSYSSGAPATTTTPKYESYSSETFGKNDRSNDNREFYNYGHGNYGDRDYDRHHPQGYYDTPQRKVESPKKPQQQVVKQAKKEEYKPRVIQPIVPINGNKGNYETMAQRLMRPKPAKPATTIRNQTTNIVVPDLSYKTKDTEDLLIDTEAHFIESRYHFDAPKSTPPIQENTYTPPLTAQVAQTYTPPIATPQPPPSSPSVNLLSEMDSLMFLGVQPEPSPPKVETPSLPTPSIPVQMHPTPIPQPNTLTSPPLPIQPVLPQNSAPHPQLPSYNYSQMAISQPYAPYAVLPTAYASTYNGYYGPSLAYNNTISNPYTSYAYQQPYNTIIPPNNPYINQQPTYPNYQAPPVNNYQSYPQSYPQPYPPISYSAPSTYTPAVQSKLTTPNPPTKNQEDFGDFKNGGSFDIQKIGWMSNKEKNLTDLTDFTIDAKDRQPKPQKKKDFGNNIKIDPWAW